MKALPLLSMCLALFAFVASTVMWSEGLATFDALSFVTGCTASAVAVAAFHLFTRPGAHP